MKAIRWWWRGRGREEGEPSVAVGSQRRIAFDWWKIGGGGGGLVQRQKSGDARHEKGRDGRGVCESNQLASFLGSTLKNTQNRVDDS